MSKVVKGVARAVKKVVKGIGSGLKKVMKSSIGRMVLIAVGSFFLGPMVAAFASSFGAASAAGSGFLTALGEGLGAAGSAFSATASGIGSSISGALGGGATEAASLAAAENGIMGSTVGMGAGEAAGIAAAENGIIGSTVGSSAMAEVAPTLGNSLIEGGVGDFTSIGSAGTDTLAETAGEFAGMDPVMADAAAQPTFTESMTSKGLIGQNSPVSGSSLTGTEMPGTQIPAETHIGDVTGAKIPSNAAAGPKAGGWRDILKATVDFAEKSPKVAGAMVNMGGNLIGGAMKGAAVNNQREYEESTRQRELERMYSNWKVGGLKVGLDGRLY